MKRWARQLRRRHSDMPVLELVGAVANRASVELARRVGGEPMVLAPGARVDLGGGPPPGGWDDPWALGVVHELAASAADRRARGAWYTPRPVVEGLVALALPPGSAPHRCPTAGALIVDPTCGGGAFLLAALDRLVAGGSTPRQAIGQVAGLDVDPEAVTVSRWALTLWWQGRCPGDPVPALIVERGDALIDRPAWWRRPMTVVGNPPFASPLKAGTMPEPAARFRAERGGLLGPYADLAAIHLLRSVEQAGPGSTVSLVLPQSVLAGRDTQDLRAHLERVAPLRALWATREPVFDAGVRACAVVLDVGAEPGRLVTIARGSEAVPVSRRPRGPWGELAADALGAPRLPPFGGRRLGELVTATAGFRDEHYALVAACREAGPDEDADGQRWARLVTVGSLDPLWSAWGTEPIRFGRREWVRPLVDREALPAKVEGWLGRQLRPKVVMATQSRLLEPWVDRAGTVAPATPTIAVHCAPDHLDRVAAVLLAPPVVAWAWRRWFGTAMTIDAVKLAARQVHELPVPADAELWAQAATIVAASDCRPDRDDALAAAVEVARLMTLAFGASPDVLAWWSERAGRSS